MLKNQARQQRVAGLTTTLLQSTAMPSGVSRRIDAPSDAETLQSPMLPKACSDAPEDSIVSPVDITSQDAQEVPFGQVLREAARLLPHQAILENFVHRNPLEVLQDMDFFEAQAHMRKVLSHPSPGARLYALVDSDPRKRANAALVELASVFLDRGAAKWAAPHREKGFLYFFAELEGAVLFPCSWRAPARAVGRSILRKLAGVADLDLSALADSLAAEIICENLVALGAQKANLGPTISAMLFDMQGYSGMFQRMEQHPEEAPESSSSPSGRIRVRLIDFMAVHSIFQRASIEALARDAVCKPSHPPSL
jgi:hypothetical protein